MKRTAMFQRESGFRKEHLRAAFVCRDEQHKFTENCVVSSNEIANCGTAVGPKRRVGRAYFRQELQSRRVGGSFSVYVFVFAFAFEFAVGSLFSICSKLYICQVACFACEASFGRSSISSAVEIVSRRGPSLLLRTKESSFSI